MFNVGQGFSCLWAAFSRFRAKIGSFSTLNSLIKSLNRLNLIAKSISNQC